MSGNGRTLVILRTEKHMEEKRDKSMDTGFCRCSWELWRNGFEDPKDDVGAGIGGPCWTARGIKRIVVIPRS